MVELPKDNVLLLDTDWCCTKTKPPVGKDALGPLRVYPLAGMRVQPEVIASMLLNCCARASLGYIIRDGVGSNRNWE